MSYLLGFPTPVAEVFLTLVVLFVVLSIYFGSQFEGTEAIREDLLDASDDRRDRSDGVSGEEVSD